MSLKSFLRRPDVADKFKVLRPRTPRKIAAPLKVEPRTSRYMLVGAAFDYLLRFELQRRAPHAVVRPWTAEATAEAWAMYRAADSCRQFVAAAKAAVATFTTNKSPSREHSEEIAEYTLELARLDNAYHTVPRFHQQIQAPDLEDEDARELEDVRDLVDLLGIVPFDALIHESLLMLNPGSTLRLHFWALGART